MGRVVRLTKRFKSSLDELGIRPGTGTGRAIARVIVALRSGEPLPADGDAEVSLPPVIRWWARLAPGTNVHVLYRIRSEQEVALVEVRRSWEPPPAPDDGESD